ncbi:hypothetical protein KAR48_08770 [bacterium]|nr:hypothetical protein [bacterium]
MIDNPKKQAVLNKVISSSVFCDADKYCNLLTYLVESKLKNIVPKEYSIAIDFFGRKKDFNPSDDTIVRYYMYRLRKMIKKYYETEGKNDKYELIIPKGHYEVKFIQHEHVRIKFYKNQWVIGFVFFSLLALSSYLFIKNRSLTGPASQIDTAIHKGDPVWSDFFSNDLPTSLLIGDHFLYTEYDSLLDRSRFQIDYTITNNIAFNALVKAHPKRILRSSDIGDLPHNSIFNLHDLEHVFYSFNHDPDIEFTSDKMSAPTDLINIADRNLIYIGGFRNLRQLEQIFTKLPITYEYTDTFRGKLIIGDDRRDTTYVFESRLESETPQGSTYLDLGIIIKLPGPNRENYLFFIGFAYPAQIETVRMFSRQESLSKIYNEVLNQNDAFPNYFMMVVKVTSFEYFAHDTKICYFRELFTD